MPEIKSTFKFRLEDYACCVYIFPCILAILCFVNGLKGEFVHDDIMAIRDNLDVTGQNLMSRLLTNDFWGTDMRDASSHKSYRPLCILTFRLDYFLSGGNPVWFHIVNTALHACVTLAVTLVCVRVLNTSHLHAFLTSTLFAVHPIHTEAVTGLVGRADVLAGLFFLLSLYAYSRSIQSSSMTARYNSENITSNHVLRLLPFAMLYLLLSVLLAAAAMLCKETGFTVLPVSLLLELLVNGKEIVTELKQGKLCVSTMFTLLRCFILVAAGAILLLFRLWIMDFMQPQVFTEESNPAAFSPHLITRFLTFLYLPAFNVWLLLCPSNLSYDWSGSSIPLVSSLVDHRNIYSLFLYSSLVVLISQSLRDIWNKSSGERSSLAVAMSIGVMVIPFLPASNMLFPVGFVIAERVLYIPSFGFCLLVSRGFLALCKIKVHLMVLYLVLVLVLATRTWDRNQVWLSRHSLFWSGVHTLPHNAKMHYNLGNYLKDVGNKTGAEEHYRTAIDLNPRVASYHLNLGTVLTKRTQAQLCFMEALRRQPRHVGALVNLGSILIDQDDLSGMTYIQQALAIDSRNVDALLAMSYTLMKNGELEEAERYISRALHIRPSSAKVHSCHAMHLHKKGQIPAALQEYQSTLTLDPHDANALFNSASIYFNMGLTREAETQLKKATALNRDCSECLALLASVYSRQGGRNQDVIVTLGQASALAPNNVQINLKYVKALKEDHQYSKARTVLQELMIRNPYSISVHKFAFSFAMQDRRYTEALQHIQETIGIAEQTGDASLSALYRDLGDAYRHNQDRINALKSYEKAINLNHTFVEAITDAGTIHFLQNNFAQADELYLKALSIDPNNSLAKVNLEKLKNTESIHGRR